ncbi:hypothetical protein JCM4914_26570 [Streptomyces platensis subsp. malvinus]
MAWPDPAGGRPAPETGPRGAPAGTHSHPLRLLCLPGGNPRTPGRNRRAPIKPHSHPLRLKPRWMPMQMATVTTRTAG